MTEGIVWPAGLDTEASDIVFARGVPPGEPAVRMGAVWCGWGESAGWSFALEHGGFRGAARLGEISAGGAEAVRYTPSDGHRPWSTGSG
ncbi:hypothetical protein ACWDDN_30135 [Streptomyces griseoruber]